MMAILMPLSLWEGVLSLIIGASLNEPHTSVTAFGEVVGMSVRGHILQILNEQI